MGRHSAPDDDEDDDAEVSSTVLTEDAPARGRHSRRHDSSDELATQVIAPAQEVVEAPTEPVWIEQARLIDAQAPDSDAAGFAMTEAPTAEDELLPGGFATELTTEADVPAGTSKPKRPRGGSADLALLRQHSDVRARCIAAVLAPFVVYFAVQIAMGSSGRQMLLFLFIPLIFAGVLVGALLDAGYKRHGIPALTRPRSRTQPVDQGARDWQRLPEHWNETLSWSQGSRGSQEVMTDPADQQPS